MGFKKEKIRRNDNMNKILEKIELIISILVFFIFVFPKLLKLQKETYLEYTALERMIYYEV
jgi:hypothetical protein